MTHNHKFKTIDPLYLYFILIIICKMILAAHTPLFAIVNSFHDDALQVHLAAYLLKGQWLGPYFNCTLVKGITYPMFLAINFIIGMPINVATTMLYGLSCVLFVYVLRRHLGQRWICAIVFTVLFFCPINADIQASMRPYRFSIVPSFVLLVFALMIGTYLRRDRRSVWWWSLGAGLVLGLFWNIREDSFWILPFVLAVCLLTAIMLGVDNKRVKKKFFSSKMVIAILPLIVLVLFNTSIRTINYINYGTFSRIEFLDGNFPKLMQAIKSVDSKEDIPHVSAPKSTIYKIFEVSPTFALLKDYMDGSFDGKGWSQSCPDCDGNIDDGHIMWCIRDGITAAGYWKNADDMEAFCQRATEEIKAALADGRLPQRKGTLFSNVMISPWKERYGGELLSAISSGFRMVAGSANDSICPIESIGDSKDIRKMELITHNLVIYPLTFSLTLSGWTVSLDDKVSLSAAVYQGDKLLDTLSRSGGDDVYQYFLSQGRDLKNARNSRFRQTLQLSSLSNIYLVIFANGQEVARKVLTDGSVGFSGKGFELCLDNCNIEKSEEEAKQEAAVATGILKNINNIYEKSTYPLTLLGMVCWTALTVGLIWGAARRKHGSLLDNWLFATAPLLSAMVLICGVAYTEVTAYHALIIMYLGGAYPLMLAFWLLSIIFTLRWLIGLYRGEILKPINNRG